MYFGSTSAHIIVLYRKIQLYHGSRQVRPKSVEIRLGVNIVTN